MNSYQMVLHRPVETAPFFGNFAFIVHANACRRKLRLLPREISKPLPTFRYLSDCGPEEKQRRQASPLFERDPPEYRCPSPCGPFSSCWRTVSVIDSSKNAFRGC